MKSSFKIALLFLLLCAAGCSLPSMPWGGSSMKADPSAEALYDEGLRAFNDKKYVRAIDSFSKLRSDHPFSPLIAQTEFKIAEAYYFNEQYPEAITAFKEFQTLHPTNENIPLVILRLGQSHFNQFTAIDRDQKTTEIAKGYFESIIVNYPKSPQAAEAQERLAKCLEYLAEHEFNIAYFYYQQEKYPAARDRFEEIVRKYKDTPTAVKSVFFLGESYRKEKNAIRATLAYEALIQHWKRLGGWVKEYEELIVWKDRLQVRIDDGLLLKGQALAKAKTYRKNLRQALTKSELAFIRNSEIRQWIHHTLWIGGVAAAVFIYVAVDRRMDCKNIADAATAATGKQKSIGLLFADYYGQHCGAERGYSLLQAAVLATSLPAIQTQPAGRGTMEFNDSGTTLATVEAGRGVKLWDSPGGQFKESRFQELQAPMAIAFAGGQLAAAGVRNAAIEIVRPGQPAPRGPVPPDPLAAESSRCRVRCSRGCPAA